MKQHPLCTDTEREPDVMRLAVPAGLKREWAALQTRRHFLGRTGKVLGWAAMASLLGDRALRGDAAQHGAKGGSEAQTGGPLKLPYFAPKAKRAIPKPAAEAPAPAPTQLSPIEAIRSNNIGTALMDRHG